MADIVIRVCRRWEFAGDGSLQGMGVCRLRLKIIISFPRRAANAYGSLQAHGSLQATGASRG